MKPLGSSVLALVVCLALPSVMVKVLTCYGQSASMEDLPEPVQMDVRESLAEYKRLMARINRLESRPPIAAPVLERAKQELEQAWRVTTSKRDKFREQFQGRGKDVYHRYLKWFDLTGVIVGDEMLEEVSQDKDFRPILGSFMLDWFTMMASGEAPQPGEWSDLEKLLPKDIKELTEEKAVEISLKWQNGLADKARKDLEKLTPTLDLDDEIKQMALEWHRAQSQVSFYRDIVNTSSPDELAKLRKKANQMSEKLTRLWPGWMMQASCGQ